MLNTQGTPLQRGPAVVDLLTEQICRGREPEHRSFFPKVVNLEEALRAQLENKRFVLSPDSQIRNRLYDLTNGLLTLKQQHPEIISAGLFGSDLKGYARLNSDRDGYIFYRKFERQKIAGRKLDLAEDPECQFLQAVQAELQAMPGVAAESCKDLSLLAVDENYIRETLATCPGLLNMFFLCSIHRDIQPYRRMIVEQLEAQGDHGQRTWHGIMQELWRLENFGLDHALMDAREKLYPKTLEEGRTYFRLGLKGEP